MILFALGFQGNIRLLAKKTSKAHYASFFLPLMGLCLLLCNYHYPAYALHKSQNPITPVPQIRLSCRSPTSTGYVIEYDARNFDGSFIVLDSQKNKDKMYWSCPDPLNTHGCPFYLTQAHKIKSPLFLIIDDPFFDRTRLTALAIEACNRSRPKDALAVFEYGFKTNLDKSPRKRVLHRPIYSDSMLEAERKNMPKSILSFKRIVVFGDSFSDNGKVWEVSNRGAEFPNFFGRYSNGPLWVEQIATKLKNSGVPIDLIDFAIGAASVLPDLGDVHDMPVRFIDQVRYYLTLIDPVNQPNNLRFTIKNTIFMIMFGLVDFRDIIDAHRKQDTDFLKSTCGGNGTARDCAQAIVYKNKNSVYFGMKALLDAGAEYFLLAESPDLLKAPRYSKETNSDKRQFIQDLVTEYNDLLAKKLIPELEIKRGAKIIRLDNFNFINRIMTPKSEIAKLAKIKNTTDSCNKTTFFPEYCKKPAFYVFWDDVHPTATVHCLIAERALELIYEQQQGEFGVYIPQYASCPQTFIYH